MSDKEDFYNNHPSWPDSKWGLGNDNWVCFACRSAVRLRKGKIKEANCRHCGKPLTCCGSRVSLPAKSKDKEWQALERRFRR